MVLCNYLVPISMYVTVGKWLLLLQVDWSVIVRVSTLVFAVPTSNSLNSMIGEGTYIALAYVTVCSYLTGYSG